MIQTFLDDILSNVIVLDLNLQKLCLLPLITGVIIVGWFKFKWLKGTRGKRGPDLRANCWFCNRDVEVQPEKVDSWRCPYCDQYNGFTEDGDYNQPLPDQFELKEFKTPTVCAQSEFITGRSVLCERCTQNQVLKLRQIAAFVPFSEATYDGEVDAYRNYLEQRYSLCEKCRKQVCNYLTDQDNKLVSKMTGDQLSLLDRLKEKIQTGIDDHHIKETRPGQPVLPYLMFRLCVCAAIIHVIFSLALYSASLPSGSPSTYVPYISQTVSVLPDWLAVWGERISACCGCAFCFGGLLAAGKHSLYPVDAVHLMLWLILTLLSSVVPTAMKSWLQLTQGRVLIAGGNMLLSLVCCLRSRHPRHFTVPTVRKKQMNQPEVAVKGLPQNISVASDSAKGVHRRHASSPPTPPSPVCSSNVGISQVEHVQQNMESLTLGLTRRSASASSVWSLPAVVAASSVSPDSTSDRMTPSCVQRSQSVLSPGKLCLLNLDSGVTADGQCNVSRSPSPWMQVNEHPWIQGNNSRSHKNNTSQLKHMGDAVALQGSAFTSHRLAPTVADRLPTDTTDRSRVCSDVYRSTCRPSVLPEVGPCDSQTPESGHPQLLTSKGGNNKYHSGNVAGKDSNPQMYLSRQEANDVFCTPEPVGGRRLASTPRRSQRIAMIGKLPKPWPLKKSLSCSIVCDRRNVDGSGFWQTRDFVVSSQVWGRNCTENTVNSALKSHLLPVQELRVGSQVCQTTLTNTKDKKLKYDCLLAKNHPYRQDVSRAVTEFSDDDCDENDGLGHISFKNKITDTGLRKNDLSWTWLLIGVFMGASLTTNVFLVCQRW